MNWSSLDVEVVFTKIDDYSQEYVVAYVLQSNNTAKANYLSYEEESVGGSVRYCPFPAISRWSALYFSE